MGNTNNFRGLLTIIIIIIIIIIKDYYCYITYVLQLSIIHMYVLKLIHILSKNFILLVFWTQTDTAFWKAMSPFLIRGDYIVLLLLNKCSTFSVKLNRLAFICLCIYLFRTCLTKLFKASCNVWQTWHACPYLYHYRPLLFLRLIPVSYTHLKYLIFNTQVY